MQVLFEKLPLGEVPIYDISDTRRALVLQQDGQAVEYLSDTLHLHLPTFEVVASHEFSKELQDRALDLGRVMVSWAVLERIQALRLHVERHGLDGFNRITVAVTEPFTEKALVEKGARREHQTRTTVGMYASYLREMPSPSENRRLVALSDITPEAMPDMLFR